MTWSWKIGQVAGIDLYVHATFLLLIGWMFISYWLKGASLETALVGVAFVLALFASVVAHELGHALTARRYGIQTRDIILLPIGGVARLERMPDEPQQEFWVALAGPLTSLALAAALFVGLLVTGTLESLGSVSATGGSFVERLMLANLSLALFNLLPAFPMDGGRVLRALLARKMGHTRATQMAATLGQAVALVFGFVGLLSDPFLVLIAVFVWFGASQEAGDAQVRSSLHGIPANRAMLTDFHALSARAQLSDAVRLVIAGSQRDFPVLDDYGHAVGILSEKDLVVALAHQGAEAPVAEVMRRDYPTAESQEPLEVATARLRESEGRTMVVLRAGQMVGLLTMDNLGEFLSIQQALESRSSGDGAARASAARHAA